MDHTAHLVWDYFNRDVDPAKVIWAAEFLEFWASLSTKERLAYYREAYFDRTARKKSWAGE